MKTTEEIREELKEMARRWAGWWEPEAAKDALAYIQQLEDTIGKMILQMRGDCGVCKHRHAQDAAFRSAAKHGDFAMTNICAECIRKESRPNWEYEGLPK